MKEKTKKTGRCFSVLHFTFLDPEVLRASDVRIAFGYSYKFEPGLATISTSIGILADEPFDEIGDIGAELELAQAGDEPNTDPQHAAGLVFHALEQTQAALLYRLKDTSLEGLQMPTIDRQGLYNEILKDMGLPSQPSREEIYGFAVHIVGEHPDLKNEVAEILESFNPLSIEATSLLVRATYSTTPATFTDGPSAWNAVNALKNKNEENALSIFLTDPWIERKEYSIKEAIVKAAAERGKKYPGFKDIIERKRRMGLK